MTLTAVQEPATGLDHYHWFTRCGGATEWTIVPGVGTGTYTFTAEEDLDATSGSSTGPPTRAATTTDR